VNRKELEMRFWGKSIASARKNGIISEQEAHCLLDEYLQEFQSKVHPRSRKSIAFRHELIRKKDSP
jgi:hypothetical protein